MLCYDFSKRLAPEQDETEACNGKTSSNLKGGSENGTEQDSNSFVCTRGILDDKLAYQVLLQLFVVGDDAIVDDDKL